MKFVGINAKVPSFKVVGLIQSNFVGHGSGSPLHPECCVGLQNLAHFKPEASANPRCVLGVSIGITKTRAGNTGGKRRCRRKDYHLLIAEGLLDGDGWVS